MTSSPFAGTATTELATNSAAKNKGDAASYIRVSGPPADLAGNPRLVGAGYAIDMGAYEIQPDSPVSVLIAQQPVSGSAVCAGGQVAVSVRATGTSPSYQWYRNGALVTGNATATSATLVLTNVSAGDAGSYSVVVTGGLSVTSTAFVLVVNERPSLTVNSTPSSILTCTNPRLTLTANTSATELHWSTGETTASISVSQTGTYSVTATGSGGCTSTAASPNITVDTASPTVTLSSADNVLTCAQPVLILTAVSPATTLLWSTGETTTSVTASTTGVYSVTATGSNGCTAVSNSLTIAQDFTSPSVSVSALSTTLTCAQPQLTLTAASSATALL